MTNLTNDVQKNLLLFIDESLRNGCVWGLMNADEEWLCCESTEYSDSEVIPFWSSAIDAQIHNVEEWADFEVKQIPLDLFVQEWLVTLDEDNVLLGINWNSELEGKEMEPSEIANMYLELDK